MIVGFAVLMIPVSIGTMLYYDLRYFGVNDKLCAAGTTCGAILFWASFCAIIVLSPMVGHEKHRRKSR